MEIIGYHLNDKFEAKHTSNIGVRGIPNNYISIDDTNCLYDDMNISSMIHNP